MAFKENKKSKEGLKIKDINLGFSDLNQAYNIIKSAITQSDKESHKITSISYFLAGLTAFASFIISLF
ncbi:hypothetical protein A2954_02260 [Candidatus Roizmanbacteria bacterium RIFCSPLOWO2_01_FULL_37_12]|uniref:Uncharacterized protein n=1 Tax=Candidatus Roizmanbacteria bacterium RIFCSPLOWO2_01_FULL_37_12 TaxID=1802056 RepID=A0A1F7I8B4_9BACT|nr:MAG: hypothetical protein A2954_02260 [Candidatus Roizmanbacteria bacterium RIFCSPLOWO2_01_FULL_37_12]